MGRERVRGDPSSPRESSLEALRRSSAFHGPSEPPTRDGGSEGDGGGDDGNGCHRDHRATDHFALLYDDRDEQLAAAIPFVRQGLERGEQCLYVADDNSRADVLAAMRRAGIDVDGALESGALTVCSPERTYRRDGEFDRAAMLEFWRESLEQARDEYGYAGLRAAAEMTWALDGPTTEAQLTTYEALLNRLYRGEDYVVLCQYNRERFPAAVIHDVVKTHPYLIVDGTISQNFYYVPPARFFDDEDYEQRVDRMTETLREHTDAKVALENRTSALSALHETTADGDRSFTEKLQAVFELGRDRLDLELGGLARIDPDADTFEVTAVSGDHDLFEPGAKVALSETYCRVFADGDPDTAETARQDSNRGSSTDTEPDAASITDPVAEGFEGTLAYEEFGVRSYLGTRVELEGDVDRTLFFVSTEPREQPFSEVDRTFVHLVGQWVQYELEQRAYERELETTVDRLQRSNEQLNQFAHAASHDLQEPIRMVSSYLQLLEKRYADDLDEEAREYIDFAVDGAERMRAMIDDLLAYSQIERSAGPNADADVSVDAFESVDCDAVLERVLAGYRTQLEDLDATVSVDSLPTVRGDREQLEQLFANLVENAITYSDAPPEIEITAADRGDEWAFSVTDSGIGIDPAKTDRIFEVFKRLHREDEYPGTGIGLALCQKIVENHGGEIRVDSEPGAGSTFTVTLPKAR